MDKHNPIVIDFETYYDSKTYTLKKMTTEAYIRDPRFESLGLSIKFADEETKFYPLETWVEPLKELMARYPNSPVVSHNANFDMGILGLRYGIHPKYMGDTVAMATITGLVRACGYKSLKSTTDKLISIGAIPPVHKGNAVHGMDGVRGYQMTDEQWRVYAEYCKTDTDLCYRMYMHLLPIIDDIEMHMISATIAMFSHPSFKVDVPLLENYKVELAQKRENALVEIMAKYGFTSPEQTQKALRSAASFAELLSRHGIEPPRKVSLTTGKETYAFAKTDEAIISLQEHDNPDVVQLVETKLGVNSSIAQTRTQSFLDIGYRGLLPAPLRYAGAHTGRYGGLDKINVQNLPKRGGDKTLRRSLTAPDGYAIIATDSSQIECRCLAWVANEQYLVDIFAQKLCPYTEMATDIFNMGYDEIYGLAKKQKTAEGVRMRNTGKETVLGCGYGMGKDKFSDRLNQVGLADMSPEADRIVSAYRNKNPMITNFWKTCQNAIEIMAQGGQVAFGGPNDDLFYADGSSVFFGELIPSIRFPNGTHLFYRNLRIIPSDDSYTGYEYVYDKMDEGKTTPNRIYGGKLTENIIQKFAFDILKYQAVQIMRHGIPVVLNVHDEWISVVPKEYLKEAVAIHAKCMRMVPDYFPAGLLDCEVDVGKNYADTVTVNGV